MDNEQDTTNDAQDDGITGLLDRFDELFDEGGVPKEGTEETLSGEDASVEAEAEDATAEPAEEATEEATAEESTEADAEPEAAEDESEASDEPDDFDKETQEKIADMENDPHPGIKFAELRKELKERDAEIERIKAEGVNTDEMQALKLKAERNEQLEARLKEMEDRLSVVDFESTPEFAAQVLTPFEEIGTLAETIEKTNDLEKDTVLNAVISGDQAAQSAAIERLVDEHSLTRRDETRLYQMADQVLHINAKRDALETQASERLQQLREMEVTQQAQTLEQQKSQLRNTVEKTFERYEGRLPGFVTEDGKPNEAWSKMRSEALEVDLSDVGDQAHAIFAANALPSVLEQVSSLSAELKEKNALIKRMTNAKPQVSTPTAPPTKSAGDDSDTFMDRLNKLDF
jgi:hypothetical protein